MSELWSFLGSNPDPVLINCLTLGTLLSLSFSVKSGNSHSDLSEAERHSEC